MAMKMPAYYSAAKKALAAVVRVDEVKDIRDKAQAMRVYAFQAKDGQLAGDATEIKMRATRRLGELMEDQRKAGDLVPSGRRAGPGRGKKGKKVGVKKTPSLTDQGIDKNLAKAARKAAKTAEDKFEKEVAKAKRMASAAASGDKAVVKAAKAERHAQKKAERRQREAALASKIIALPDRRYGVIYADPEWKFKTYSEEGKLETSAEMHYPTSDLQEIKDRDVESISADDAVLFLWATVPMLPQALEVMMAWGFDYKSHVVWVKDRVGTGYWFLNKHEMLLVGTRGKIPAPAQGTQWASVVEAPRGKHSEKPAVVYDLIEAYFPNLPKIELNARKARKGWDSWGLEAPVAEAAE